MHGGAGGGVFLTGPSLLRDSVIVSNSTAGSGQGGGVLCQGGAVVQDCVIAQNVGSNFGGGVYCDVGGTVTRCTISNNMTGGSWPNGRGAGVFMTSTSLVQNCIICNNYASDRGGGIALDTNSVVRDCIIRKNVAQYYGGGADLAGGGYVYNCTIVDNSAINDNAGGVHCYYGGSLLNDIIYFNYDNGGYSNYWNEGGLATFSNCCLSPVVGGAGNPNNTGSNPGFIFADRQACRLQNGSPCIDAGYDMSWMHSASDVYGKPRYVGHAPDIGAAEFGRVLNDYDYDGVSDYAVYTMSAGQMLWYIRSPYGPVLAFGTNWGFTGCTPVPDNFAGQTDLTVYNPSSGMWYKRFLTSSLPPVMTNWGFAGTVPVVGNYDQDNEDDLAVYQPSTGKWYIYSVGKKIVLAWGVNWGFSGCTPVTGDYNADGQDDLAV